MGRRDPWGQRSRVPGVVVATFWLGVGFALCLGLTLLGWRPWA